MADDKPPPRKPPLAHTVPRSRTPPKGMPATDQDRPIVSLTIDDRDRRKSDSAGGLVSTRRASSQYESWEDCSTPPTSDAELYRAIRQVGLDIERFEQRLNERLGLLEQHLGDRLKEMAADQDEQRVALMNIMTRTLDRVLDDKRLEVTSTVKVQETGALSAIENRSADWKLRRKIAWQWYVLIAGILSSLATALIARYL
jgi:hypothetical protein